MPGNDNKQQKQKQQHKQQQQNKDRLIQSQRNELDALKKEVSDLSKTVSQMRNDMLLFNSRMEISNHVTKVLQQQVESLQQYSRRHCLIIDGMMLKSNEKVKDVESEVKKILVDSYKVDNEELKYEFDKAHRIGKAKGKNQSVIVRFKSHGFRAKIYSDRKQYQNHNNINNVENKNKFKLRVCLTNQRRELLDRMNKWLCNDKVEFCFANVNGDLKVRLKDELDGKKVIDIKSENDIDILLDKLIHADALAVMDDQFSEF